MSSKSSRPIRRLLRPLAIVASLVACVAALVGCATQDHYYAVDEKGNPPQAGDTLVVLCGRADGVSQAYTGAVAGTLRDQSKLSLLADEAIKAAYPDYPVNIVGSTSAIQETDYPRLQKIGARLGVKYVLATWATVYTTSTNGIGQKVYVSLDRKSTRLNSSHRL